MVDMTLNSQGYMTVSEVGRMAIGSSSSDCPLQKRIMFNRVARKDIDGRRTLL